MPGLFGLQGPAIVALAVVVVVVVVVLAVPAGRRALGALAAQVARWPRMIRAEMRGAAPLRVDGGEQADAPAAGAPRTSTGDTTPDIPAVPPRTRAFPVVERPDRV